MRTTLEIASRRTVGPITFARMPRYGTNVEVDMTISGMKGWINGRQRTGRVPGPGRGRATADRAVGTRRESGFEARPARSVEVARTERLRVRRRRRFHRRGN